MYKKHVFTSKIVCALYIGVKFDPICSMTKKPTKSAQAEFICLPKTIFIEWRIRTTKGNKSLIMSKNHYGSVLFPNFGRHRVWKSAMFAERAAYYEKVLRSLSMRWHIEKSSDVLRQKPLSRFRYIYVTQKQTKWFFFIVHSDPMIVFKKCFFITMKNLGHFLWWIRNLPCTSDMECFPYHFFTPHSKLANTYSSGAL